MAIFEKQKNAKQRIPKTIGHVHDVGKKGHRILDQVQAKIKLLRQTCMTESGSQQVNIRH